MWSLDKCSFFLKVAHNIKVFSDPASLVVVERKYLSGISNQRMVRILKKTHGFCFTFNYVRG